MRQLRGFSGAILDNGKQSQVEEEAGIGLDHLIYPAKHLRVTAVFHLAAEQDPLDKLNITAGIRFWAALLAQEQACQHN